MIDEWRNKPGIAVKGITLEPNERIVGIRSAQCGFVKA